MQLFIAIVVGTVSGAILWALGMGLRVQPGLVGLLALVGAAWVGARVYLVQRGPDIAAEAAARAYRNFLVVAGMEYVDQQRIARGEPPMGNRG